ncbi:MAG: segregation/condensation protein A [Alphaproteobacteria bacterium]|nr:segregation/condensation protein A [Alphaproteobacteria bacterium]MCD8526269.1 segregation/condensation protein A [Alphaproteobacteria bacterium]MCD8571116.1 segregation/condensation protein A [Alphaproteobacteria bacterium]
MSATNVAFEEDPPRVPAGNVHEADSLLLRIDGYEGPIEVLLELARNQKVDLAKISILQLVRQYLEFVERAKALNLELAAEYLVMAAWLTYLKSRLLLPKEEGGPEPSAAEMAEALQFQLRRLEAMQKVADKLMARPQLGQDFFPRGAPEEMAVVVETNWDVDLYDVLKAYGDIKRRADGGQYDLPVYNLMSTESALERLTKMLGNLPRKGMGSVWATLSSFMPDNIKDKLYARSALASTFTAGLELVKQGRAEIKQDGPFRPIYVRALAEQQEA